MFFVYIIPTMANYWVVWIYTPATECKETMLLTEYKIKKNFNSRDIKYGLFIAKNLGVHRTQRKDEESGEMTML